MWQRYIGSELLDDIEEFTGFLILGIGIFLSKRDWVLHSSRWGSLKLGGAVGDVLLGNILELWNSELIAFGKQNKQTDTKTKQNPNKQNSNNKKKAHTPAEREKICLKV